MQAPEQGEHPVKTTSVVPSHNAQLAALTWRLRAKDHIAFGARSGNTSCLEGRRPQLLRDRGGEQVTPLQGWLGRQLRRPPEQAAQTSDQLLTRGLGDI